MDVNETLNDDDIVIINGTVMYGHRGVVSNLESLMYGIFIFTFMLVGGTMNFLLLVTIIKRCEKRDLIMIFISAFCVTDLTSSIVSPLWWYRSTIGYEHFRLPSIVCRLSMIFITTCVMATSMLIFMLAIIRYRVMKSPLGKSNVSPLKVRITIVCIFLVAIAVGVLTGLGWGKIKKNGLSYNETTYGDCSWDVEWKMMGRILSAVVYPLLVFIPMIGVIVLSIAMVVKFRKLVSSSVLSDRQLEERQKKERVVLIQFLLIVLGFMIGFIPLLVNTVRKAFFGANKDTLEAKQFDHNVSMSIYVIQRFAEMLNPCLYLIGSSSLRRRVKNHLKSSMNNSCMDDDTFSVTETSSLQDIPGSVKVAKKKLKAIQSNKV